MAIIVMVSTKTVSIFVLGLFHCKSFSSINKQLLILLNILNN